MLTQLQLENFRVFRDLTLNFDSPAVIFEGSNGQGKTSLLEAVFFTANLRSFRTLKSAEIRTIGTSFFRIRAEYENRNRWKCRLGIDCGENKFLTVDHVPVPKASDFTGRMRTVAFLPDDPSIISGSSILRRRFFDMFISMMDREYYTFLQGYSSALKTRNYILKSGKCDQNILNSYNVVLAACGSSIVKCRLKYAEILSEAAKKIMEEIRPELSGFTIRMKYNAETREKDSFCRRLQSDFRKDVMHGFTGTGPHLDDFDFIADGKSLRTYGSRGQLRISSFALKLGEYGILKEAGELPGGNTAENIVLADDVFGDLDQKAKDAFFREISGKGQIFYTFTEIPDHPVFREAQIVRIQDGKLRE